MSAVRVRKRSKAPLAYVPIEPQKVVVVPTDNIPDPNTPSSPINQEYLQREASRLASPSTSRTISRPNPPNRLRSQTLDTPTSPPLVTPPKRGATSVFLESNESLEPGGERTSKEQSRATRTSWFSDHVMNPLSRATGTEKANSTTAGSVRDRTRFSGETDRDRADALSSSAHVDVIIPDEARSGLGLALANREHMKSRESNLSVDELHHNDIVEHLDVLGMGRHIRTPSFLTLAQTHAFPQFHISAMLQIVFLCSCIPFVSYDYSLSLDLHSRFILANPS